MSFVNLLFKSVLACAIREYILSIVMFRSVLRVLLENLEDEDGSTRALVFGVLTEMLKQVRVSQHSDRGEGEGRGRNFFIIIKRRFRYK